MDDGETFDYKNGQYFYWGFIYKKEGDHLHSLSSKNLDERGKLESDAVIEKIIIRGVRYYPSNIHIYLDGNHFYIYSFHVFFSLLNTQGLSVIHLNNYGQSKRNLFPLQRFFFTFIFRLESRNY